MHTAFQSTENKPTMQRSSTNTKNMTKSEDSVEQVISEGKGIFEDASLITEAEEKALVRKIDRK